MKLAALLWRVLRGVGLALAAIVLFVEEWGWRPLTAFAGWLVRRLHLQRLEARIAASPRRVALLLFLAPAVLLFPLKLLALWFIEQGRTSLGIAIIVGAKLIGTAFVGRLFVLVERQLMTFPWFARALNWWRRTKERVLQAVRSSPMWRTARAPRRWCGAWLRRAVR